MAILLMQPDRAASVLGWLAFITEPEMKPASNPGLGRAAEVKGYESWGNYA